MTRLLPDSNVIIRFINGVYDETVRFARADALVVSPVVLGECLAGLGDSRRDARRRAKLDAVLALPNVVQAPIGAATAECYARLWRMLSAAGRRIPSNDVWIAAQAWELSATLVTADRHFGGIPGLSVLFEPDGEG